MSTINPNGKDIISVSTDWCGKKLTLEVNRVGFRTSASVLVSYGDTVVLGTAMVGNGPVSGMDYFPLSIDYEEKFYALLHDAYEQLPCISSESKKELQKVIDTLVKAQTYIK